MIKETSEIYAVLPLRDIVVFPSMIAPLFVGRAKSIRALEESIKQSRSILLVTQKNAQQDEPGVGDIHKVGVFANILQLLKLPDGSVKVLVEGSHRGLITQASDNGKFLQAAVEDLEDTEADEKEMLEIEALVRMVLNHFEQYVKLNKKITPEVIAAVSQISDPSKLADNVASHLALRIAEKQEILGLTNVASRLEKIYAAIEKEILAMGAERRIRSRVEGQIRKSQKDHYLNEQLKAIQRELNDGEGSEGGSGKEDEITRLQEKIEQTKFTTEAKEKALEELNKLKVMNPMSGEASVTRNYLEWMLSIPWKKPTRTKKNLPKAKEILNRDHYGLDKVKERILEYLAVQQRTKKHQGSILCLVGPPGVGKTSLVRSIAEATGRNFARISLGGVRDEAEIRGHRRTYVGSMPGKIIQSMKKAKSSNPLILLDEVDKMGYDHRGDPASAMLEILDPKQNAEFNDHYIEVGYDLSNVLFIATANSVNLPRPLLDRMEIIRISGYMDEEKVEIAKRHIVEEQRKQHGLKKDEWALSTDALRKLIHHYTREAGVRNLEREIANLARKSLKDILMKGEEKVSITGRNLHKYAGVKRFNYNEKEKENLIGITTGLAYTEVGGDILLIEAVKLPGKGNIKVTGKLGDVMQESVQAAFSYVRSRCADFGVMPKEYQKIDIHIHVPEGATPKDGPSAGVAMCTSIVSIMTGIPVKHTVAMTGEMSLRGRVLPIGGLKEKLLAAARSEIEIVLIPKDNEKDLEDVPEVIKKQLDIRPINTVDEALHIALERFPEAVEWMDADTMQQPLESLADNAEDAGEGSGVTLN